MKTLQEETALFVRYHQTLQTVLDRYIKDHELQDPLGWWQSLNLEVRENGEVWVEVHWEEDSRCSCCSNISGVEEIPLEELLPYIENQWALDDFDRQLARGRAEAT